MLRIQAERLAGLQLDLEDYKASYQLTGQRLAALAPEAVVLHPGPIIRGMEITAGVADGVQSAILEQVTNGLAIRMAVMERALTAETRARGQIRPRGEPGRPRMTALAICGGRLDRSRGRSGRSKKTCCWSMGAWPRSQAPES